MASLTNELLPALVMATREVNELPSGGEFKFHATSGAFRTRMDGVSTRISRMLSQLITKVDASVSWDEESGVLVDDDDKHESLKEITEMLLERVDLSLDELNTVKTTSATKTTEVQPLLLSVKSPKSTGGNINFMHARNVIRPQLEFPDTIDNSLTAVFVPLLQEKPNALVALDLTPQPIAKLPAVSEAISSHMGSLGIEPEKVAVTPSHTVAHPYQTELDAYEPTDEQLSSVEEIAPKPQDTAACHWVDDLSSLKELQKKLDAATEIALDFEAHSYRTYDSFCCLMQVSTRTEDFLVDTLALRGEMSRLNTAFTNPKIVKVLHGADRDILWMQKDLGLYIVNMFDTGQAARVLDYQRFSLAFLLHKFCDITADKQYQLADWRIRPLTAEMAKYAQEDTHNLLYIYDKMRNDLVDKGNPQGNLVRATWMRSREVCLQKFEKPLYNPHTVDRLIEKFNRALSAKQYAVLQALHVWRDKKARMEDESVSFVCPDHMLFQLADNCPTKPQLVVACCQRSHKHSSGVPSQIQICSNEIKEVIIEAIRAVASGSQQPFMPNTTPEKHRASPLKPHSTAIDQVAVTLEPSKIVVGDVKLLQGGVKEASAFAKSLASTACAVTTARHEDVLKTADVDASFKSRSLFGPALDVAAVEAAAKAEDAVAKKMASESATQVAPTANEDSNRKRKSESSVGYNNDVVVLSKMQRTHVPGHGRKRSKKK